MRILDDKQPWEEYYIEFDFTNAIGTEGIGSATVSAINQSDIVSTDAVTDVTQQKIITPYVYVWIKGGVDLSDYTITCKAITSASPAEKYELEALLPVREISRY